MINKKICDQKMQKQFRELYLVQSLQQPREDYSSLLQMTTGMRKMISSLCFQSLQFLIRRRTSWNILIQIRLVREQGKMFSQKRTSKGNRSLIRVTAP